MSPAPRIGRPSGYRPEAIELARQGLTQPEIAVELGVTNRTISRWALKYPGFRAALDQGLDVRGERYRHTERQRTRDAERAAAIRELIAKAAGDFASTPDAPDRPQTPAIATKTLSGPARRSGGFRPERRVVAPQPEDDQDPMAVEPLPLLDPRDGW